MFTFKHLQPRVTISHKQGGLAVHIQLRSDRGLYMVLLVGFTMGFLYLCGMLLAPFFRRPLPAGVFYMLPVFAFLLLWYFIGLRIAVWRAFGVEDILVEQDKVLWTRKALWWKRKREIPVKDITQIKAVTPWHALKNHVEFTAQGRHYSVGEMLLSDEATKLAHALNRALGSKV